MANYERKTYDQAFDTKTGRIVSIHTYNRSVSHGGKRYETRRIRIERETARPQSSKLVPKKGSPRPAGRDGRARGSADSDEKRKSGKAKKSRSEVIESLDDYFDIVDYADEFDPVEYETGIDYGEEG